MMYKIKPGDIEAHDLDEIYIRLPEIGRACGVSDEELLADLQAGTLQAQGEPDGHGGYRNIAVRADHLARWMVKTGRTFRSGKPS